MLICLLRLLLNGLLIVLRAVQSLLRLRSTKSGSSVLVSSAVLLCTCMLGCGFRQKRGVRGCLSLLKPCNVAGLM